MTVKGFVRDNALSVAFLTIFVLALAGQSIAGYAYNNEELTSHGQTAIGYLQFVSSSAFLVDVAENWQSEFLQFFLFIFATVWLIQLGSNESKEIGKEGKESDKQQKVGKYAEFGRRGPRDDRFFRLERVADA